MPVPYRQFVSVPFQSCRTNGSAEALGKNLFERPNALRLAAGRAVRTLPWIPGEDIEMRPARRLLDEALQEQCRRDRTGEAVRGDIVHVGDLRRQLRFIGFPQR